MAPISGDGSVQRLNAALDSDHAAVAAYTTAATMLDAQVLPMVQSFLAQEQEHAAKLTELVRELGGTPYQPKSAEEYARGFAPMESREDVLRVAVRVERDALDGYLEDAPRLTSRDAPDGRGHRHRPG